MALNIRDLFPDLIREEGECLIWLGWADKAGYGKVKYEGKLWLVHRLAWYTEKNKSIKGINILHHCDNPPCLKIEHLFEGSHSDNLKDCWDKGRREKSHEGETHPSAKLSANEVIAILSDNRTHTAIAKEYGVSRPAISLIKERKNWRHVQ